MFRGTGSARNGARTAQRTVPTKKLFSLAHSGLQPISKAPGQRHLSRWTGAGEGKCRTQSEECIMQKLRAQSEHRLVSGEPCGTFCGAWPNLVVEPEGVIKLLKARF